MTQYAALFIILLVFAAGDIIGTITKATISTMFTIMLVFFALFVTRTIPADICTTAGLTSVSAMGLQFLLVDMGSSVEMSLLRREWRTVATASMSLGITIIGCLIIMPIIGRDQVIAGAPVITGGIVATTTMVQAAEAKGLTTCAALATFIYATQKFVGTLPASSCGLKVARNFLAEYRENMKKNPFDSFEAEETKANKNNQFCVKYGKYYTNFVCLAIAATVVFVAYLLGKATNGWVSQSLWSMIIGIALRNTGIIKGHFLRDQAKAVGFFSFLTMITIIPSLAKVDLSTLPEIGFAAFLIFLVTTGGVLGVFLFTPAWKLVGSRQLAIGISMCQMIGYPGTQLIADEIAKTVGQTQEEQDYLSEKIGTAYVISGFTTVTWAKTVMELQFF
ncbi:MAG: hypothetical protein PHY44_03860 [Lachnospiraceae bacterium]|nr:hypothetical protein [Lachnospiraceae bacterium]